ncbi:MAG: hypothetical protein FJ144_22590 [Deltaproteobacteria bacterium]|nr:hypothetical protein [Deltaproteobacteria bacterium]
MQHQLNLAQTISERRARECERLEREFALLRAERDGYRHQLEERNRMLAAIFGSRSWRWTRALRRTFGRG